MSDIKAKVYDKQYGGLVFECSHDRYNRLCEQCAKEVESIIGHLIDSVQINQPIEKPKKKKEIAK